MALITIDGVPLRPGYSDIKMTMRYARLHVSAAKDETAAIMHALLVVE